MNDIDLIEILHNRTIEIYSREGIRSLRNPGEEEYMLNGKNILEWHSEATAFLIHRIDPFDNIDSLLFVSDEIMYFTSQLYFYRPHLFNPLENPITLPNGVYFPYYMSISDKRYFMISEVIFEKFYAFWGFIAQLLAGSLKERMNDYDITFSRVLSKIQKHDSDNFKWLRHFYENDYRELNERRRIIVHQRSAETQFRRFHSESASNIDDMERQVHVRNGLPEYFKNQINNTLEGFEMTLNFISEK